MRSCALLLSAMFLLSGVLHDRFHQACDNDGDLQQARQAAHRSKIRAADESPAAGIGRHAGEFCPVCAGLIQFFLADGQVEIPLTFAEAEEAAVDAGIVPSAAPFFHQPRAPPVFPC